MIVTLNSLWCLLLISISFHPFSEALSFSFIWNIFLSLLILPNSLCLFLCIRYITTFPKLGKVALHWRHPMGPSSTLPLVTRAICSQGVPYVGCVGPPAVVRLTTVGVLAGRADPSPVGCQALPHVVAAGPLVGNVRSQYGCLLCPECPRLVPAHCWSGKPPVL